MKLKLHLFALATIVAATFADPPSDSSAFDILHGSEYNDGIGTTAGRSISGISSTLPGASLAYTDLFESPYLFYNHQYVALSPTNDYGTIAYNGKDMTTYLHMFRYDNQRAKTILGIATKTFGWDFSWVMRDLLDFNEEKSRYDKTEERFSSYSNSFGTTFSMPLTNVDFSARVWFIQNAYTDTLHTTKYSDADGKKEYTYDRNGFTASASLIISNRPSAKGFSWKFGGYANKFVYEQDSSFRDSENPDNNYKVKSLNGGKPYTFGDIFYSFGAEVLKSSNARIILGGTVAASARVYDKQKDKKNGREDFYIQGSIDAAPQILAEYAFNKNWMFWHQTALVWANDVDYESYTELAGTKEKRENSLIEFESETSAISTETGLRFQYGNLALESTLSYILFRNPLGGFDGRSMFTSFEAIYFF